MGAMISARALLLAIGVVRVLVGSCSVFVLWLVMFAIVRPENKLTVGAQLVHDVVSYPIAAGSAIVVASLVATNAEPMLLRKRDALEASLLNVLVLLAGVLLDLVCTIFVVPVLPGAISP